MSRKFSRQTRFLLHIREKNDIIKKITGGAHYDRWESHTGV